jgi:hypothetical protein
MINNTLMKNKISILLVCLLSMHSSFGQSRLVLNGGIISIHNNAYLVINNPDVTSIQRYAGYIVSEGENNRIKWNLGTAFGNYTVPFGYNNVYLPVTFSKTPGTGSGAIVFSTYHTGWKNSDFLPTGVTHFGGQMPDHSAFALDRFWQVFPEGYTAKPSLTDLTFTYLDAEHQVPSNTITENNLKAQQWNSATNSWDRSQAGTLTNTSSNTVTIPTVASGSFYQWWILVDSVYALPIRLLSFNAAPVNKNVAITWKTSSEEAGTMFVVARSKWGNVFEQVATIVSSANGSNTYHHTDVKAYSGVSYYRIEIAEPSGKITYTPVRKVSIAETMTDVTIYPNPILDKRCTIQFNKTLQQEVKLTLIDTKGTIVMKVTIPAGQHQFTLQLPMSISSGVYKCIFKVDQTLILQKDLLVN